MILLIIIEIWYTKRFIMLLNNYSDVGNGLNTQLSGKY